MMSRWHVVAVAALMVLLAACGSGNEPSGDVGATDTTAGPELAPWCEDLEPAGPVAEGNLTGMDNGDQRVIAAIAAYGAEHPETFGSVRIDRDHGGTVVASFTDDPEPHLDAILALPLTYGDALEEVPGTSMGASPSDATTSVTESAGIVASSGMIVDVVQVAHTEAELSAVQDEAGALLADADVEGFGVGSGSALNRVTIDVARPDDELRRLVAENLPIDAVCVSGRDWTPPPTIDPATPPTLIPAEGSEALVSCGGGSPYPASALDAPLGFEDTDHPVALALRDSLDSPAGELEMTGGEDLSWRLLFEDEERAVVLGGDPPSMMITFEWTGDRWIWAGSGGGECRPAVELPEGLGEATWSLDPSFPAPAAADSQIHILVTEMACTGATPIGDRLVGPEVRETADTVAIAVAVVPLEGLAFECPGNPSLALTVELEAPLGDRTLTDAAGNPPGEGF